MPIKTDLDEQSVSPSVKPIDLTTTSDHIVEGGKMSATTQSITPVQQPDVLQTITGEPVAVMKTDKETLELTTSDSIAHTTISLSKVTMSQELVNASTTLQLTDIVSEGQVVEIGSGIDGKVTSDKVSGFISTFKPTPIPSKEHKPTPETDVIDGFTQKHLTDGKSIKDDKTQAPENIDIMDKELSTIIPETTVEVHQTTRKMAEKSTPIVEVIQAKHTTPMPIKTDLDEQSVSPSVKPIDLTTTSDPIVEGGKMSATTQSITPMQQPDVVQTTTGERVAVMHTTISLSKVTMSQELVNASTAPQLTDVVSEGQVVGIGSGIEGKVTSDKVSGFISTFKPTPIPSKEHKPTPEADVIDGFTQKHLTDGKSIKDDKTQPPENIDIMDKELTTIKPDTTVEVHLLKTEAEKSTPIVEVIEAKLTTPMPIKTDVDAQSVKPIDLATTSDSIVEEKMSATTQSVTPMQHPNVVQTTTGEYVAVMKTEKETLESTSSDSIAHTTISLSKVTMSEELVDELGSGVDKTIISPTNETKFKSDKPIQVTDVFPTTARSVEVASTTAKAITVQQNTDALEKLLTSLKPESSAFVDVSTTPKVTDIVSEKQDIVFGSGVEGKVTSEKVPGFMSTFKPTPIPSKVYKHTPEVDVIDGFTQKHLTDVKSIKDDKTQAPKNIDKMDKELTTIKPDTTVEVHITWKTEAEKSTPIVEVIEAKTTTPMPIKTDVDEQSVKPIDLATTSDPIVEGEKISATTQSVTPMQQPNIVQMTTGESVAVVKTDKETSESILSDSIAHTTISPRKVTVSQELVYELGSGVDKTIISPANETKFKSDKPMQVIDVFTTTARPVEVASTTAKAITVQQNTDAIEKFLTSLKPESSAFVDVSTTPKVTDIVSEEQDIVFASEKVPGFMSTFKPTPIPSKVFKPTPEVDVIDGFTQKHLTDIKSIKDDKTQAPKNIDKMDKELTTIKPDTTVEVHITSKTEAEVHLLKTEAEKSTPIVEVIEAKPTTPMPIKTDVDEQSVKPIDLATASDPIVEGEKMSVTTQSVTPMQQPDVVQTTTVTVSQELVDELGSGVDKTIISPTNETKFKSDKPMQVIDVFTITARPVEVASTTAKAITVQQNTDAVEKLLTSLKPESSAFVDVSTTPKVTDIVSEEQDIVFGSGVEGKVASEKVPGFMSTFKPTSIPSKVFKPTPEVDVIDGFTQKHLTDVKSIKDDKTQAPKNIDKMDKELTTIKPDTTVEVHITSKTEAEKSTPIVEVIEAKPTTPMPIKTDVGEQSVKPIDLATTNDPIVEGEKMSATTQSVTPMQQPDVVQTTIGESVAVMKTDKETLESTSSDSIAHTTISLRKVTVSQELVDELGSGVDKTIISPTNETKFKSDKPMQVIDVFTTTARPVEVASTTAKAITVQQNTDALEKLLTSLKPESSAFVDVSTTQKVTDIVSEEQDIVFGSGVEAKLTSEKVPGFMSTFKPTPIPSKVYKPTPEVDVIDGFTQKHLTDVKSIKDDKTQALQNIDKMDKELTTIKPDTTVEVHVTSKTEAEKSTPIVEVIEAKPTTLMPIKTDVDEHS
ncbi:uncharacterized protein LOC117114649, partial [Anneissia japonica]|uniref:uncharacterized protein LOC117114649 n=1 Tax=Anneissia japonica TaxID=1529436 RepID=UPI001425665D